MLSQTITRAGKPKRKGLRLTASTIVLLITLPTWILAWLADNSLANDVAALVGVGSTSWWIWRSLGIRLAMFRMLQVGAITLSLMQNLAWLMSSFYHRHLAGDSIELTLNNAMAGGATVSSYASAVLFISLLSLAISAFASANLIQSLEDTVYCELRSIPKLSLGKLYVVLATLAGVELYLLATGVIGQRTVVVEGMEEGQIPWWLFVFQTMLAVHLALNGIVVTKYIANAFGAHGFTVALVLAMSVLSVSFVFFCQGRRSFVFAILAQGWWTVFFLNRRPHLRLVLVSCLAGLPIVAQGLLFSQFLRHSATIENKRDSIFVVLPAVIDEYLNDELAIKTRKKETAANYASRPLVATPLALCMSLPMNQKRFLLHQDIVNSFVRSLPRQIFPWKSDFPVQETLLYANFPIGISDTADSIGLSAYTSFGWAGIVTHSFLLVLIYGSFLFTCHFMRFNFWQILTVMSPFLEVFTIGLGEAPLVYLFNTVRAACVLTFIFSMGNLYFGSYQLSKRPRAKLN